jgi:hypothetical protein
MSLAVWDSRLAAEGRPKSAPQGHTLAMSTPTNLTQAFYLGAWLPCRILDEDTPAATVLVRVVDRSGMHEIWLPTDQVKGR